MTNQELNKETLLKLIKENVTFKTELIENTCYGDILEVSFLLDSEVIGRNTIQIG